MSISSEVRSAFQGMKPGEYVRASDFTGSPGAVATALSRECSKRTDVVRVRKGLYWKGVSSRFGAGRPDALDSAVKAAGLGAGPSGWSALAALAMTTQVPSEQSIAVPGRQVEFSGVKAHRRSNLGRIELNPSEIAVLEVLRDGWFERAQGSLASRVRQLAADGVIDMSKLLTAAHGESSPRVRQRMLDVAAAT